MDNSIEYLKTDTATNDVNEDSLKTQIAGSSISETVADVVILETSFVVVFENDITSSDKTELDGIITNHEHITTAESMKQYLEYSVYPFIEDIIYTFAAENIAMGITQAGKANGVLALFELKADVDSSGRPISLKGAFDTGSLYAALDVLSYHRTNISNYSDLTPFITDARLLALMNKIETFLGIGLST